VCCSHSRQRWVTLAIVGSGPRSSWLRSPVLSPFRPGTAKKRAANKTQQRTRRCPKSPGAQASDGTKSGSERMITSWAGTLLRRMGVVLASWRAKIHSLGRKGSLFCPWPLAKFPVDLLTKMESAGLWGSNVARRQHESSRQRQNTPSQCQVRNAKSTS